LPPEVEDRGRAPFAAVLADMRALHAAVHRGEQPGRVLLVEHDAVYTAGRATPPDELRPDVVAIERGGKVTYHGPGQLVVYPVLRLPRRDVRDWLRRLERFGVQVAARFGLEATPSVDGTGVFLGNRKFASIGVAVKHWINLHGIAINVAMDLGAWQAVRPCGLSPDVMTDLSTAAGRPITMDAAKVAARDAVSAFGASGDPL
jgi:lipoyl(octanoyl) transferase